MPERANSACRVERPGPGCGLIDVDLQNGTANEDELAQGIDAGVGLLVEPPLPSVRSGCVSISWKDLPNS
jgi:hypothetical protein